MGAVVPLGTLETAAREPTGGKSPGASGGERDDHSRRIAALEATVNGGESDDHSRRIAVLEATVKKAEQRAEAAAVAAGKLIARTTNAEAAAKACTNFGR